MNFLNVKRCRRCWETEKFVSQARPPQRKKTKDRRWWKEPSGRSHGSRDFRNRRSNGSAWVQARGGRGRKNGVPCGGTLWAVRPMDRQINGPCGGSPNANCNTGCWEGCGGREEPVDRPKWIVIGRGFNPRAPPLVSYANERVNVPGDETLCTKGLEERPKIQSLGASTNTEEAVHRYRVSSSSAVTIPIIRRTRVGFRSRV